MKTIFLFVFTAMMQPMPLYAAGRFTVNDAYTVSDTVSGLMWQRRDDATQRAWQNALAYCEGLGLGGYFDWRLPNVKELTSIVEYQRTSYTMIDSVAFPNTQTSDYWSSSPHASFASSAWYVNFVLSVGHLGKSNTRYVRCVR